MVESYSSIYHKKHNHLQNNLSKIHLGNSWAYYAWNRSLIAHVTVGGSCIDETVPIVIHNFLESMQGIHGRLYMMEKIPKLGETLYPRFKSVLDVNFHRLLS